MRLGNGAGQDHQQTSSARPHAARVRASQIAYQVYRSAALLIDAHRSYAHSDHGYRGLVKQAFYTRLDIADDGQLCP